MPTITLHGGPCDGQTFEIPAGLYEFVVAKRDPLPRGPIITRSDRIPPAIDRDSITITHLRYRVSDGAYLGER